MLASLLTFSAVSFFANRLGGSALIAILSGLLVSLPVGVLSINRALRPVMMVLAALEDGVRSFRAGDFSLRLTTGHSDELADLVDVYNEFAGSLSLERSTLRQRELVLHSVLESSPISVMLVNAADRIIFANRTARTMFFSGNRLEGHSFAEIVDGCPPDLARAMSDRRDALATVEHRGRDETFLISRRSFELNARHHSLVLVRQMTQHLRRQEVIAWKRVIRTISHELNNSLAPIRSLIHSARLIRSRDNRGSDGSESRLDEIFDHIDESAAGLHRFIAGYAEFARLPEPRLQPTRLDTFVERLQRREGFTSSGELPAVEVAIDPAQVEQVLVNLLKNARESGSPPEAVEVAVELDPQNTPESVAIHVLDRGTGMDSTTIEKALVPFYSAKKEGTGLGLALSQEILEAHGGALMLSSRPQGGLKVTCRLPLDSQ